jgi:dTDP-4-amino-4,6-dideoxygalactose transaminase
MQVKFLDFTRESDFLIKNGIMEDIEKVIRSGYFLLGPKTKELEEKLSERFNSNVILVGSGTDALYLSLRAFGIGPGNNVAVPAISAIPTASAVKMTGANPVYVDVDAETGLINLEELEKTLKGPIDAVIIVHLYGNTVNSFYVKDLCEKYNIPLIEDCAQAFDSVIFKGLQTSKAGTIGNAGALSFYPSKSLGSFGDSGAVISDNVSVIQKVRELRFYGQVDRYVMGNDSGINSRVDEIQCSILLKKLEYMDALNERRRVLLKRYNEVFVEYNINFAPKSNPHLYPLTVENRKKFMREMAEKGIETLVHYPFTLPASVGKEIKPYVNAEYISNHIVSIPFNVWMTEEEIEYVLKTVSQYLREEF